MVLQSAVAALLFRLGAGADIPIGWPSAGRVDEALDELVGFFVDTLVLRADLSGDPTFDELLGRVREQDLSAFSHQEVPFERVVEVLNPPRVPGRHPLFQVMVAVQGDRPAEFSLDGVADQAAWPMGSGSAKFDLSFAFAERFDEAGQAGRAGRRADLRVRPVRPRDGRADGRHAASAAGRGTGRSRAAGEQVAAARLRRTAAP